MDKEQGIYKMNWDWDKQNTQKSSNFELIEGVFDENGCIVLELVKKQESLGEFINWGWSICTLKLQGEESKLVTAELRGGGLERKAKATIVDFLQASELLSTEQSKSFRNILLKWWDSLGNEEVYELLVGDAVLTVSLVNQKENGGEGFTFTTYIYPNGRDNDYALENTVSFSTISEALLYIDKIIKTIEK